MSVTPHWMKPVAVAVNKIKKTKANLEADFDYGVNILRRSLLENNSFDIGNLSEKEQRGARRCIAKFSDCGLDIPPYVFEGLRNQSNDWLAMQYFLNKVDQ